MDLVGHCLRRSRNFEAVAGRAYYAVFQKAKHILEAESFDYPAFLQRHGLAGRERVYSHGTIVPAFIEHIRQTRKVVVLQKLKELGPLDELYQIRRKADYFSDFEIDGPTLEECYRRANNMLASIDELRRLRR